MPSQDTRCPFCGTPSPRLHRLPDGQRQAQCERCGACGPTSAQDSVALERWAAAHASGRLLRAVIDESPDIILVKDWDGRFLLGNAALARHYGTTTEDLVGKDDGAFNPNPEEVAFYLQNMREVMIKGATQVIEESSTHAETGEVRFFHSIKKPIKGPDGEPRLLVIAHDVTALQRAHQVIAERERSYAYAMAAAREGIWDWHIESGRVDHSPKWCDIMGLDAVGPSHTFGDFQKRLFEEDRQAVVAAIQIALEGDGQYEQEHRVRRPDGTLVWVLDRGQVVERDAQGRPTRMAGSISDITRRKNNERILQATREELARSNRELEQRVVERTQELERANHELHTLARRDVLTGLPNRLATTERLQEEFARFKRTRRSYAVVLFDIDHFKQINDTHGHGAGDEALQYVARLLREHVRECDHVARHGGEEFLLLLPETDLSGAIQLAEKIRAMVAAHPLPVVGTLTVSGGVAVAIPEDVSTERAINQADFALYQSKRGGRNQVSPTRA
jgi:diguanylate cyclase (GGDEF)-like protein/PAS domain S-box-containing protein